MYPIGDDIDIEEFQVDPYDFKKINHSYSIKTGLTNVRFVTQVSTGEIVTQEEFYDRHAMNFFIKQLNYMPHTIIKD